MSKQVVKILVGVIVLLLVFGGGVWLTYQFMSKPKISVQEQSDVLLEKINTVAKLVSVEGVFSEIYEHNSAWEPLPNPIYSPSFSKKALIIVKAKVSAGYDLQKMTLTADHERKVIRLSGIPDPEIISIEHDLSYYDIQESTFNTFTKEELTQMNRSAKEFIRKKALESDLLLKAEEQGNRMIEIIEFMVEESGWKVEYDYDGFEFDSEAVFKSGD